MNEALVLGSSVLFLVLISMGGNHVLADQPQVTITPVDGSGSSPDCKETPEGCNIPMVATVDIGGVVIMSNTDTVAHTFTSGSTTNGTDGVFDSSFLLPDSSFEWRPDTAGEYPYFCLVHPWREGTIVVTPAHTNSTIMGTVFTDINGNGIRDGTESGRAGQTVLYVSLEDMSNNATTTTTDMSGVYVFHTLAGGYLVQIQNTDIFNYLTILEGQTIVQDFALPSNDTSNGGGDGGQGNVMQLIIDLQAVVDALTAQILDITQRLETIEANQPQTVP